MQFVILMEEHRLRGSENETLRKKSGPKKYEVTQEQKTAYCRDSEFMIFI
jgi:hypothetical protein